jgi:hypothetical protein
MSVHGSISRQIDLCSIRWERHIPEQGPTNTLLPGWNVNVTLPFVNVTLSSMGASSSWRKRLLHKPFIAADRFGLDVNYAGFSVGVSADNGNTGELGQGGDCTVLG